MGGGRQGDLSFYNIAQLEYVTWRILMYNNYCLLSNITQGKKGIFFIKEKHYSQMNNYIVRLYRDVIVVTKIATRRSSKAQSIDMY